MGQVTVTLNGRSYRLSCGDGEEQRLFQLAEHMRQRIDDLSYQFKNSGDERLLVMAALMITDELWDTKAQLAALEGRLAGQDWDAPHGGDATKDGKPTASDTGEDEPSGTGTGTTDDVPKPATEPREAKPAVGSADPETPPATSGKSSVVQETSLKRALDRGSAPQISLSQRLAAAQLPRKSEP